MNRLLRATFGLFFGLLALCLASSSQAETLRIGSWNKKDTKLIAGTEAVLTRAYGELKQPVEFVELPIRRALQMLLSGELDGNAHRVAELATAQPSLIRIETPVNMAEIRVYTRRQNLVIQHWGQLSGLRIAHERGVLTVEGKLPADSKRVEGRSIPDVFRILDADLADVAVITEAAHNPPYSNAIAAHIRRLDVVLDEQPLYHYLTQRHSALAIRLNTVLKRMEASGEINLILQQAYKSVPDSGEAPRKRPHD